MCLGIPGQIVALVDERQQLATVEVSGVRRTINVSFVVDAQHPFARCVGTWVLVHVGFAMSRIDAGEAARTLELLRAFGQVQEELDAMRASGLPAGGRP